MLAELIDGRVTGIDISEELINLAPNKNNVTYLSGRIENVNFDSNFDLIWICLVLGGIPNNKIEATIKSITDLLNPGGGVFLVENTHYRSNASHWTCRTKKFYTKAFPKINMEYLGGYKDAGEEVSIFFGRK